MGDHETHERHERKKQVENSLFDRISAILEQAMKNVVCSVNSNMVIAYWLIGREIFEEIQGGEPRAEYGKQVLEELSVNLNSRYGSGFSVPNLQNFRKLYQVFQSRLDIQYPAGTKSPDTEKDSHGSHESFLPSNQYPAGTEWVYGFHPQLSWSHYRALMRVSDEKARAFYEQESAECGWTKAQLERQIQSSYYERILTNHGESGLLPVCRERLPGESLNPIHVLKSPYVLEFLDLPEMV
ncbi:MAG: hypothetical protein KKD44_18845 [Proteobacteria bacterium]|nr:hypothetical protein [Pseudomonadota bacterium]